MMRVALAEPGPSPASALSRGHDVPLFSVFFAAKYSQFRNLLNQK
jgi:hypothetical protein